MSMGVVTNCTCKYQECIDTCIRCAHACTNRIKLCRNEPDVQARKSYINMSTECASICKETTCFMSMDAQLYHPNNHLCIVRHILIKTAKYVNYEIKHTL
jgi:hypothetical protein